MLVVAASVALAWQPRDYGPAGDATVPRSIPGCGNTDADYACGGGHNEHAPSDSDPARRFAPTKLQRKLLHIYIFHFIFTPSDLPVLTRFLYVTPNPPTVMAVQNTPSQTS